MSGISGCEAGVSYGSGEGDTLDSMGVCEDGRPELDEQEEDDVEDSDLEVGRVWELSDSEGAVILGGDNIGE